MYLQHKYIFNIGFIFNMNKQIVQFLAVIFLLGFSNQLEAQKFSSSLLLGVNAAQIEGDELAGFHKAGLHAGLRVSYPIKEKMDIGLELLFSQRGSRSPLSAPDIVVTNLDYISIPLFINFKDWYIEDEKYFKVRAEGGFSYGYLFDVDSTDDLLIDGIGNYRKHDVSIHTGVSYSFRPKMTFTTRYSHSLFSMYSREITQNGNPTGQNVGLLGYFLTFRLEFKLL